MATNAGSASEWDVFSELQKNRMSMNAAVTCQEKCVEHYWTNSLVFYERSCMESCTSKFAQTSWITSLNFNRFEELEAKKAKGKK